MSQGIAPMPFVDISTLNVIERLPGWYGRYFHSTNMTFAHYDFKRGASIHEHFHLQEEVYEVIEGELEVTIDGEARIAGAGVVAVVPSNARHFPGRSRKQAFLVTSLQPLCHPLGRTHHQSFRINIGHDPKHFN
jgi:mannose-6-phosphate isomerase-like protein (cupin superfamily)